MCGVMAGEDYYFLYYVRPNGWWLASNTTLHTTLRECMYECMNVCMYMYGMYGMYGM